MNHCKTCKHWAPAPDTLNGRTDAGAGGYCCSDKITENYGRYQRDALVYEYNEGGEFWVGPEFGCVHHEEMP